MDKSTKEKSWVALGLAVAVFCGCMIYVFAPVLSVDWVTQSPDFPKYYPVGWRTEWLERLLTGKDGVVPFSILSFLGHPLWRQELFFILTSFFAGMSVFYYLRTQSISRLAACGGALFFAFSGYSFTLFCAGHGGYFMFLSCGLFAFGLINRCFQTHRVFHFMLLGAVVMWSEIHQPDIWLLFVFLMGTYTLWRSFREWREKNNVHFLWSVYPKFLLTGVVMLLIGSQQIKIALSDTLAGRKKQIEGASSVQPAGQAAVSSEQSEKKKMEQWIFATNWSLPPEDVAEFFVPGIFGDSSFQPPYPYWGRLGQPYQFQKGRMMPNYRQHTVYMGIVGLLLAAFGVSAWFVGRNRKPNQVECPSGIFADIPFWAGVCIISTVIALGRYSPLYKMVYQLPFMDYLRAPVKFHHLTEFAAAILSGFGLHYLIQPVTQNMRKRFGWVAVGMGGVLLIGLLVFLIGKGSIEHYIASLGFGQLSSSLVTYSMKNLVRAIILAGCLAAAFFWTARKIRPRFHLMLACGFLAILGAVDLAVVARRYVFPINVGLHHSLNPVVKAMQSRTGNRPAQVMNYVTAGSMEQDWFSASMTLHGFNNMAPSPEDKNSPLGMVYMCYQNAPVKYWQIMGVRFVILPLKRAVPLIQQGWLTALCEFELGQSGQVRIVQAKESCLVLAEVKGFVPLPALYSSWRGGFPIDEQLDVVRKDYEADKPVVSFSEPSAVAVTGKPRAVEFRQMRRMPGAFSTSGRIENVKTPSVLVFNEIYQKDYEAFVDGKQIPVGQANGLWAAIEIPAGSCEVVLRIKRNWTLNAISVTATLSICAWLLFRLFRPCPNN
jgi:hypothetical protein